MPVFGIELPQDLRAYYEREGSTAEDGSMSEWDGRGKKFVSFLTSNWRPLLASWNTTPPSPQQAALVASAAEAFSGPEYLAYLNVMLDHRQQGRVNEMVIATSMSGMGQKMGFVASNFQHPDVQNLVARYRSLASGNPDQVRWCEGVLKGAYREQFSMFRSKTHSTPEILPLPKPSEPTSASTQNGDGETPSSPQSKAPESKPAQTIEEPSASTSWLMGGVMIVAAIALAWLLLKNRK